MILRTFFFLSLVSVLFTLPLAFFIMGTFLYAIRYTAYECVLLALCVDAYFGLGGIPYYVIGTVVGLCAVEWIKPRLLSYTTYNVHS